MRTYNKEGEQREDSFGPRLVGSRVQTSRGEAKGPHSLCCYFLTEVEEELKQLTERTEGQGSH